MLSFLALALLVPPFTWQSSGADLAGPGAVRSAPRNVAILVYEGVELLDFAGPGEVFSAAHGSSGRAFRVFTVAKTRTPVTSQGFLALTPEFTIADCPAPDLVVVPGGNVPEEDRELQEWLKRCARTSELLMTVCNGAFLAAEAGLLDGLEVTTHHGSLEGLTAGYPELRVLTNRRFVDSGRVLTCAGVSAGIDGALHVVARLHGDESARRTARYMEYDWRPDEIAARHAEPGRTVGDGVGAELAARVSQLGLAAALAEYQAQSERPSQGELEREGHLLLRSGKGRAARALFELLVAAFPDSPAAHDGLSQACERLGDAPAALAHAEAALAKLKLAHGLAPARARALENASASRLVRLGRGDAQALRFACTPCGGECDEVRYLAAGACPACGMELESLAGGG